MKRVAMLCWPVQHNEGVLVSIQVRVPVAQRLTHGPQSVQQHPLGTPFLLTTHGRQATSFAHRRRQGLEC